MTEFHYVGSELDLFACARRWKAYWSDQILPYVTGDVLEVGAGIASNTPLLARRTSGRWVCLEPDPELTEEIRRQLKSVQLEERCESVCGTIARFDEGPQFDTILYIDVLEHIDDDGAELRNAASRLRPGGRIIVLSPAHQQLFTAFDAATGHYRRYNRASLQKISPHGTAVERIFYLDSVGLSASAANRMLLRQSMPTKEQLAVWDKWMIPASVVADRIFRYSLGKTIVGVWRKPDGAAASGRPGRNGKPASVRPQGERQ